MIDAQGGAEWLVAHAFAGSYQSRTVAQATLLFAHPLAPERTVELGIMPLKTIAILSRWRACTQKEATRGTRRFSDAA